MPVVRRSAAQTPRRAFRSGGSMNRLRAVLAALFLVTGWIFASPPQVVEADCPGGAFGYHYAAGGLSTGSFRANGTSARIQFVNATTCFNNNPPADEFSAERFTICRLASCNDGWVQVGMIKRSNYAGPRAFCEFETVDDNLGHLHESIGTLANQDHTYRFSVEFPSGVEEWDCYWDGLPQHAHTTAYMGFDRGVALEAGGETTSTHGQLGKNSPGRLLYSTMQHRLIGVGWVGSDYSPGSPGFPYDVDRPQVGQLRDWTDAH